MTPVEKCGRCGSPTVGNESFCSNCGERLGQARGRPAVLWLLGGIVLLGVVGVLAVWVVGRRVTNAVHARLGPEGSAALRRVTRSLGTASRESHRDRSFGCTLLSEGDASAIAGTRVTRTESSTDGCGYFGIPDPSVDPDADSIQEMTVPSGGGGADPKMAGMIRQMTGAMRSQAESTDPGTRAGPGGERPLFTLQDNAALSLTMELAKKGGNAKAGGEEVPGLGDDAFFVTMHRMFFVRSGTAYLLIQPQFVKDRRGVAIEAARKVLESPQFRREHS